MQPQPSKQLSDLCSARKKTHTLRLGSRLSLIAMSSKCQLQLVRLRSVFSKKQ